MTINNDKINNEINPAGDGGGKKARTRWTPEAVLAAARAVVEEFGPEALTYAWLNANGRSGLGGGISKNGGMGWVKPELGLGQKRKPNGTWTPEAILAAGRAVVDKHGAEAITNPWLYSNGYGGLARAIQRNGGYVWARAELGIDEAKRAPGTWTKEYTIAEAKAVVEQHGPEALAADWLAANGHAGLRTNIIKNGGICWIQAELGVERNRKPMHHWSDIENLVAEALAVVDRHGPRALTKPWLYANGYSSLVSAIAQHGGINQVRESLGMKEGKKRNGAWTAEATISESEAVVERFGAQALTANWLEANNRSDLSNAIKRNGGLAWLRAELGLPTAGIGSLPHRAAAFSSDLLELIESLGDHIHALPQKSWLAILQHSKALRSIGDRSALAPIKIRLLEGKLTADDIKRPAAPGGSDTSEPAPLSRLEEELAALVEAVGADAIEEDEELTAAAPDPIEAEPLDVVEEPEERRRRLIDLRPEALIGAVSAAAKVCANEQLLAQICRAQTDQLWASVFAADGISQAAAQQLAEEAIAAPAPDKWAALVRDSFLSDWRLMEEAGPIPALQVPAGQRLNLMQHREAALLLRDRARLNISGMGAGKTRSAICGAQLSGRRRVLVLCPNNTISTWQKELAECLPIAAVAAKSWSPEWQSDDMPRWLINNHEMLSDRSAAGLAAALRDFCPDAVVIDEIHLCKVRDKATESQRHRNLTALATWAHTNEAMLYGLSGTPLVNDLGEVVDLLKLINPELAAGLKTQRSIENCLAIHEALQPISSRFVPSPFAQLNKREIEVRADHLLNEVLDACESSTTTIDAVIAPAKFDALLDLAKQDGKLLVFTSAVAGVMSEARAVLAKAGIRAVVHSGEEKLTEEGNRSVDAFIHDPTVKVLIASTSTLATGFDGLQKVCSRITFLTLPWTAADYEQALARVLRQGITSVQVELTVIVGVLTDPETGEDWSLDQQKLKRLTTKRSMAAAVCDGVIPEKAALVCTEEKVKRAHKSWSKRVKETLAQATTTPA